jgi:hypothetical protein
VPGEELGRRLLFGSLPSQSFRAVFAEDKGVGMSWSWVGPSARRAFETTRLIHGKERGPAFEQNFLFQ